MASKSGQSVDTLAEALFKEPYRFGFFQAVRLLERLYPERQAVGRPFGTPGEEVVRFRTTTSLAFSASPVEKLTGDNDEGGRLEMFVNFMGLTGPSGVLPYPYTEELIRDAGSAKKDTAYWKFLDIFNHRLISLFYRAWEKYRFHIAYERDGEDSGLTEYLFDLIGLGTPHLRGRSGVPDEGLFFYSGLIAQRPHSASMIAAVVGDHFGVPVRVEQFCGRWLALNESGLTRLGRANNKLGVSAIAGARVWDNQSKFRLVFGPLVFGQFVRFLPAEPPAEFDAAVKLTRLLVGLEFDFDIELRLRAEEVPECRLGGTRLGWTSWLKTKPATDDRGARVVLPGRDRRRRGAH